MVKLVAERADQEAGLPLAGDLRFSDKLSV